MKTLTTAALGALVLSSGALALRPAPQDPQDQAAVQEALPEARTIVDAYLKATGRSEVLAKAKSIRTKGKVEIAGMGIGGGVEVLQARPNLFLTIATIEGMGETRNGYDGKVGWMIQGMMGPMVLDGFPLAQLQEQARFDSELYPADHLEVLETTGKKTFEGKECWEVRVVLKPWESDDPVVSDPEKSLAYRESFHYFAVDGGLLVGTKMYQASPQGDVRVSTVASDYKEFGGVKFATHSVQKLQGVEISLTIDSITFDDVQPDAFALPAEIKALVDK